MVVCRQIGLLLWKNFTVRRRRWSRVIFELIWPLFLFLILMWVRTRNLTFYYDPCYNDERYLGSTGFMPALQTYMCRWNNTCFNLTKSTDEFMDFFNDSSLYQLFSNIADTFSIILNDAQTVNDLSQLITHMTSLSNPIDNWDGTILAQNPTVNNFNGTIPVATIALLFANPVRLVNLHQSWFMTSDNLLSTKKSNLEVAAEIYLNAQLNTSYQYQSATSIQQSFCINGQFNQTFTVNSSQSPNVTDVLCNTLSPSDLQTFLINVQQQLDQIFLNTFAPSAFANATAEVLMMLTLADNLQNDLTKLNVSLPSLSNNFTFSLTSLCDGRNDLSNFFQQSQSTNDTSSSSNSTNNSTTIVNEINWIGLAANLSSYSESDTCLQGYTEGSGSIKQTVWVTRRCRCNVLDQAFSSAYGFNQLLNLISSLIYGKIFYYPSRLQYKKLIQRMNETFDSLNEFVLLLRQIESTVTPIYSRFVTLCNVAPVSLNISTTLCQQIQTYEMPFAILSIFTEFLACTERNRFVPMTNTTDMVTQAQQLAVSNQFLAAIVFLDDLPDVNTPLPNHIRYEIRMTLDQVDKTFQTQDRYFAFKPRVNAPFATKYFSFGFIYLQNSLERAIINEHTGQNISYGIKTQQMPYPCWVNDKFANSISRMLPLFMVLSWIFTVSMNVKDIVEEKEKRLKEIMRIMGLKDYVHWLTWFILCVVVMLTIALLLVVTLKFGKIIQFSNFFVLLLLFFCYTLATITQCFLLSVFFNRANLAACGAGILYFLLYLPYTILLNYNNQTLAWHKIITCLSSTVAFGLGCDYIARFEGMAKGIQWENINKGAQPNDNFTFLACLIMMLIDSVIYMLLTIYIENVFPGEYGIPQPWYYPVTKTYWFGFDAKKIRERTENTKRQQQIAVNGSNGIISADDDLLSTAEIGVEIQNLSKYYGNKLALKNLSIKFYRNMITAFLGRNGAGKSTTWSILTGLIPPSSGTAFVDGYDILTDIKMVRKRLGFAPQHNILFDLLTVEEHLKFFSGLKDAPRESINVELEKMLDDLALQKKRTNYSTELSGGMKRKLSIAIAFIGNSTTVILDEPTAGVDPFARRAIWDLILKYKTGRTIVLSTHHLDEADLLSDRLAIISSGELQCIGTTMFLKRKYGEGYNLIVELTSTSDEDELQRQQPPKSISNADNVLDPANIELQTVPSQPNTVRFADLTLFLKTHMSDIRVKEAHGDQITYVILDDAEHTKIFPAMLGDLDQKTNQYRIKGYGLSNSSLEQVFLRVADEVKRPEDYERLSWWKKTVNYIRKQVNKSPPSTPLEVVEEEIKDDTNNNDQPDFNEGLSNEWSSYADERYTGARYVSMQLVALLIKRFHRTKRNIKGLIAEILLPIIFVLLAMLVTILAPNQTDPPPLILHPWYWDKPNHVFQSLPLQNASQISISTNATFAQSPSLGTRCMQSTMLDRNLYPCDINAVNYVQVPISAQVMQALNSVNYNQTRISPTCDCQEKMQTCPIGGGGPDPSYNLLQTKDILYQLQGYNISDWSVKTEFDDEFMMSRFGGIEFLPLNGPDSFLILNETLIKKILNLVNMSSQQSVSIDAAKIAALFRVDPPQVSIWFNNKGWPASVAFLNIFNNALLRGILLQNNSSISLGDYGITASSHPLPQSQIQLDSELESRAVIELFSAICVIFALSFIPASFLVFLIDERMTTSKHLQFVSGVKGLTYWCANFLWDLMNYSISIILCMIIFLAFNIQSYVYKMNFLCLILLLFLYGFSTIPLMYSINYLFQTPSTGFVLISCINIFIGLITTIATYTLESFSDEPDLASINAILMKVFLVFPHYCLGRGLFDMSKIYTINEIKLKYLTNYVPISPFQFNLVGRNLLSLFIQGIVFFLFALLVQYRFFIPDRGCVRTPSNLISDDEDDDVAAERQRIYTDRNNTSGDVLRMIDLVKVYGWRLSRNFTAVKRTCAGVKQGECFGLLGINGSGKSTTFKMLTGEIPMTAGNAFVNNFSVLTQLDRVHQNLGYCPQFDALDSLLTAREHLYFYARLRGIKRQNISFITECLLKRLGLTLWADRPVRQYSGGNKRKLSTAIALIGNPSVIFMDEPTTGMDVRAKRFLWNCILTLTRTEHKSVVITSHSMEECETLCNRLVIMGSGQFKCLGSVQHLKAKFGDGYTILIRTNIESDTKMLIAYIIERLPEATIKEEHNKMLHFRVSTTVPLHRMFSVLETARQELNNIIEDYTVTQVTLDDVFVNFAKIQEENEALQQAEESEETSVVTEQSNDTVSSSQNIISRLLHRKKKNVVGAL